MHHILIIDDEKVFLETMEVVLRSKGFSVMTAMTPAEGIKKLKETKPDLVILDVMMPRDYEGFEVARVIREDLKLYDLPILMLSNIHHVKKVPYRFAPDKDFLPVDVFVDKPMDPDDLLNTVIRMVGEEREEPRTPL